MPTGDEPVQDVLTQPNAARIYDYWLGGKDHMAVDREVAVKVARAAPHVIAGVRANRAFLRRAVAYLAEAGVEQFVDCADVRVVPTWAGECLLRRGDGLRLSA